MPQASSKIVNLTDEVRGGESRDTGILGPALPVWQVTRAAAARRLRQTSGTVCDHVGHRRMVAGKPIDHVLPVTDVDEGVRGGAAIKMTKPAEAARPPLGAT